jgi:Putative phage serine protease XkdF
LTTTSSQLQNTKIAKSVNLDKRLATFVVLEPQEADGMTTDQHGDWYSEEEVEKACHNFNTYCRKANLLHLVDTDAFTFVESYISKVDMVLGDTPVKKGTWLATCYFEDEELWQGVKDGTFDGLSIQCVGTYEKLED